MTYATQTDLTTRFGTVEVLQLTDRDGAVGDIDVAMVERALLDADAEIDGYLAARYALPLPSVPRLLVPIACDIARYRLYEDRTTEQVTRRYEDAVKQLKALAKGELQMGLDAANSLVAASQGGAQFDAAARTFSAGHLADYSGS